MSAASAKGVASPALPSIGIIGCGNMGGALARGMLTSLPRKDCRLYVYDNNSAVREPLRKAGAVACADAAELARQAECILVAVKPQHVEAVVHEIAPHLQKGAALVSIAAGVPLASLRAFSGGKTPVARVMPNTLAGAGKGFFGLCFDDPALKDGQRRALQSLFALLGEICVLPESAFNAYTALAGCGPGYVFHLADALIEAGVSMGLTRSASSGMVFSLLEGCAELVRQSGKSPSELREQVCSPGGMTIAGINHLDRTGVRGHIIDAVLAAEKRGKDMEKN